MSSSRASAPRFTQKVWADLQSLGASSWFAYGTIALLQLKLFWNAWQYRDLTFGDTSSYFISANLWYEQFRTSLAYSPLYTVFYGSLMHLWNDAYALTLAHRIIIALTVSLLVLALMRRLLPSPMSWIISAWWVILPTTYDSLYEVHLFSVIPPLIAYLIAAYRPGMATRGAALGVFVITTFLVRNEFALCTVMWVVFCVIYEVRYARQYGAPKWVKVLAAYGIPLLFAAILVLLFYIRAVNKFPGLSEELTAKHTVNICQIYAYSYQQRFTDWTLSPWTQCSDLMQKTFGRPLPSLTQAIQANSRAMLDYFLWNIRLIPDGVQVLMFGATGGSGQPDYAPVTANASYASVLSVAVLAIVVSGVVALWRDRRHLWDTWLHERVWGWLALMTAVPVAVIVCLVERPRPEYLYTLSVFLIALTGLSLVVLLRRAVSGQRVKAGFPIFVVLVLLIAPSHFVPDYRAANGTVGRPLMQHYERLVPVQNVIAQSGVFLTTGWGGELCNYIGLGKCTPANYDDFRVEPENVTFAAWLNRNEVTVAYLDGIALADTRVKTFLKTLNRSEWKTIVSVDNSGDRWMLLQRQELVSNIAASTATPAAGQAENVPPSSISVFPEDLANSGLNSSGIYNDGWTSEKVKFCLVQPADNANLVIRGLVPLVDNPSYTTEIAVSLDNEEALRQMLALGNFELHIPSAQAGQHCVALAFSSSQVLPNGDGRHASALLRFAGFDLAVEATSIAETTPVVGAVGAGEVSSLSSVSTFPADLR